jgi:hypothetical protein
MKFVIAIVFSLACVWIVSRFIAVGATAFSAFGMNFSWALLIAFGVLAFTVKTIKA